MGLRQYIMNVYGYMGLGIGLTAAIAFCIYSFRLDGLAAGGSIIAAFAMLGIGFYFSFAWNKISFFRAQSLFWVYAALMGIFISHVFYIYTPISIVKAAFVAASTFGCASAYGHVTQRDLTSVASFLLIGLVGVMLASVVNLFLSNSVVDFVISVVGVMVFLGIAAYQTQALKQMYFRARSEEEQNKMAIFGALNLYLAIVNIFIFLLHLVGERK
ncbi:membrane protein [Candidatus Hydrogenosomobacter endosymbioticus]|uniref:Membrane protein n=1 Tax=Candidatus Hydrogenosomobacter endosymbioticus TaxID=2558174 RepID=A0ABM7V884_9PROT|nr:membrane protein [Candidatus Hydrogenosomobacter endosymbioticus]